MDTIEVEIRSFLTEEQYHELLRYFRENAVLEMEDQQESHYFDCPQDLRIQKNNFYAKIWLKKGKLHDPTREEIEVKVPKEDFPQLQSLFVALQYPVQIKWFRTRHQFVWQDITVTVDYTKGYGYILELEKMASLKNQEQTLAVLRQKMQELGIPETPKEIFDQKYQYYKENWQKLV